MLIFVVIFSLVPLMIDVGGGTENPFLLNAVWRVGGFLGCAAFLLWHYFSLLADRETIGRIFRRAASWMILFAAIGKLEFVLYALSTRFIDISATAVLYETWPILMVFIIAWMFRTQQRFQGITVGTIVLLATCFLGYIFVIGSQKDGFAGLVSQFDLKLVYGVGLVVLAAIIGGAHNAVLFRWGANLGQELRIGKHENNPHSLELFGVVLGQGISQFLCLLPSFTIGLATGEVLTRQVVSAALIAGILVSGISDVFFRQANSLTNNLGVNAIAYSTPILGLLWLVLFARIGDVQTDYLIIGAAAIIIANLLINFEAEIEFGFKALIMSLWACGAVVYLRPAGWVWEGSEGYFGVLGLSATLFTLILAFRVSRFVDRTSYEDNTMYSIFHTLDLLARRGVVAGQVRENMMNLDAARNIEDTYAAYGDIKLNLQSAQSTAQTLDDQQTFSQTEASLDSVIHSKQRGNNFGEFFALIVFAVITVAMALLARPEQSGWTGFLVEMFTFPFCAVIVFLTVNAWDVHRDWLAAVFSRHPESGWYGVLIRDESNRDLEQWASVAIGLAVTVTYAFLLWDKWLG